MVTPQLWSRPAVNQQLHSKSSKARYLNASGCLKIVSEIAAPMAELSADQKQQRDPDAYAAASQSTLPSR